MSSELRTEANRKLIGKDVYVVTDGGWKGVVMDTSGEEDFLILRNGNLEKVSLFDVRSLSYLNKY